MCAQTCIALRTMVVKDGIAYLQAGVSLGGFPASVMGWLADYWLQGGIVLDSDPYDEWMETINKLSEVILVWAA